MVGAARLTRLIEVWPSWLPQVSPHVIVEYVSDPIGSVVIWRLFLGTSDWITGLD